MKTKIKLFCFIVVFVVSSCSYQPDAGEVTPIMSDVYINRNGGYYIEDDTRFPETMQVMHFTYGENYLIPDVARDGYSFVGWQTDKGLEIESSGIWNFNVKTITIKANWNIINYSISYNLNGGTIAKENPVCYNIETETFVLNVPEKSGKRFAGWFLNDQKQSAVIKGTTGDLSFEAHWTDQLIDFNSYSFGSYPQKRVTDYGIYTQLVSLTPINEHGDYILDDKKYRRVGDSFFSFDPIEWIELERKNNQILLISKEILYTDIFKNTDNSYFIYHGNLYNCSNYAYSDIRRNLCDDFYATAFSLQEKELIINDVLDNKGDGFLESTAAVYSPFISTYDNVFLLDTLSYYNLGYHYGSQASTTELIGQVTPVTEYANFTGPCPKVQVMNYDFYFNMWYLRQPLEYVMLDQRNIVGTRTVTFGGLHGKRVYASASPSSKSTNGVRPCIRIPVD